MVITEASGHVVVKYCIHKDGQWSTQATRVAVEESWDDTTQKVIVKAVVVDGSIITKEGKNSLAVGNADDDIQCELKSAWD